MDMDLSHEPVLYKECMDGLSIRPDGLYVDGTLGGGGHADGIASLLGHGGRLICIDRDPFAIDYAGRRLERYGGAVTLVRGNYADIADILHEQGVGGADGILLDLGVSSFQLDDTARGFSYHRDAPLDMRMEQVGKSAADVVNGYDEGELAGIIARYGEERFARRIARAICDERQRKAITTTLRLADIIREAVPAPARRDGHPARRTFQAIRIEVNGELEKLGGALGACVNSLNAGGRLCVITFHSLEDRIAKDTIRTMAHPCSCPPDFPVCVCGKRPAVREITKKPIVAGAHELERNTRARSAKLRICEKI